MTSAESEIERRIALLNSLPIIRENGWRPNVSCQWVSDDLKIVSITLLTWRYLKVVMVVTRESKDVQEAIDEAFTHITEWLEEAYEARDTGQAGMSMDQGA